MAANTRRIDCSDFPPIVYHRATPYGMSVKIYGVLFHDIDSFTLEQILVREVEHIYGWLLENLKGKFIFLFESGDQLYIGNDLTGSYRIYYSTDGVATRNFEDFSHMESDSEQLDRVAEKGYTAGNLTTKKGIKKLLPCELLRLDDLLSSIAKPYDKPLDEPFSIARTLKSYDKILHNGANVGVAFSGGSDSAALVKALLEIGITPSLYFLKDMPVDSENLEECKEARTKASMFGLSLVEVEISPAEVREERERLRLKCSSDLSDAFCRVRVFLRKLDFFNLDTLLTGQNCDSFINFGVTRKRHPIETPLLYMYKRSFRRLFYHRRLSILDRMIGMWVYGYRRVPQSFLPRTREQLASGLSSEYHYLPRQGTGSVSTPIMQDDEYFSWMIWQKMFNHIAGNHSIVWSDAECNYTILMPFSDLSFVKFGLSEMKNIRNVFNPKKALNTV